jgi:hypothetical protein
MYSRRDIDTMEQKQPLRPARLYENAVPECIGNAWSGGSVSTPTNQGSNLVTLFRPLLWWSFEDPLGP